jgi:hypothetical protein
MKEIPVSDSNIKGRTVTAVREMTGEEINVMGWEREGSMVIEFDHGHVLVFAMRDPEGNGPGTIVWQSEIDSGYV